jgi:hypothetical protein
VAFALGIVEHFTFVQIKAEARLCIMNVQAKLAAQLGSYDHHVTGA